MINASIGFESKYTNHLYEFTYAKFNLFALDSCKCM